MSGSRRVGPKATASQPPFPRSEARPSEPPAARAPAAPRAQAPKGIAFEGDEGAFAREHNSSAAQRWIINGKRLADAAPQRPQLPPLLSGPFADRREVRIDRAYRWRPPGCGAETPGIAVMRNGVFNPAIIEDARTGALHLYARARDDQNVSRIVHLVSTDGGARYQLDAACPVPLAPELLQGELADWAQGGGCEDARIFECRDRAGAPQWRMAFTVYNAERNVASIGFASAPSPGGPWAPEGLAFPEEVAAGRWTKSFVATRLPDGSYVGWGSRDISIPDTREGPQGTRGDGSLFMATSPNGRTWKVVVDPVALPREGAFDSRLVESAFVTPLGDGRFCLFVNGDGPPEGYQLGYQIYRPPTLREQVAAKLRGNEKLPLVLSERSSGPCFSHDQSATWETGPVEKVVFVAGGVLLAPRNGEPGRLRIAYGCNDMVCATADAPLA